MPERSRQNHRLLAALALTLLLCWTLTPFAAAGEPPATDQAQSAAGSLVAPQDGLLPPNASDQAIEMIGEHLVSQGGRYHDKEDVRVAPEDAIRAAAIPASGDLRIDALISGYQWTSPAVTYSFYSRAVFGGSYYGSETVGEVSEGVKANVRRIMAWYSSLIGVDFVEVQESASTVGLIRFMTSNGPSYAYSYYPSSSAMFSVSGDVHLNPTYDRLGDTNGFQHPAGQHGYVSLVHEIGHSLGLKHPFDGSPVLPTSEDNDSHTVMSYTWNGSAPGTPMAYDILALQYIYGARAKNAGNDVYLFASRGPDQYTLSGEQFLATPYYVKQAIWDSAGVDTLDLSGLPANSAGYRLDMKGTGWLVANNQYSGSYFGNGTALAASMAAGTLINSGSSDTIFANSAANAFKGYNKGRTTGNDVIYDADGADTVDLSAFAAQEVTQSRSEDDLVLGLGSYGTITLKAYYLGKQPGLLFAAAAEPSLSVRDASVIEGNSGTSQLLFTVSLSAASSAPASVRYATAGGTASAGSDFVEASGTLTFAPGETAKTVGVAVAGDTVAEADETFTITISDPAGAIIGRGQAVGTITNDDQPPANQSPVARASASVSSGPAPLAVTFDGSGSSDADGSIASYSWSFGDGTTGSGARVTHSYATPGSYSAVLIVRDDGGATATAMVPITVQQAAAKPVHVASINITLAAGSRNGKTAVATVTVTDESGARVAGAVVNGKWSGAVSGTSTGTTGADGTVTLTSKSFSRTGTVTFTVSGVTPPSGYSYDAGSNVITSVSMAVAR